MINSILTIVAAISGVIASIWINNILREYLQKLEDLKQAAESRAAKEALADELERRTKEHDRLKEIEKQLP